MPKNKPAAAPAEKSKKSDETLDERKARHEAACAEARSKLGSRASPADVGEAERRAVADSDAAA